MTSVSVKLPWGTRKPHQICKKPRTQVVQVWQLPIPRGDATCIMHVFHFASQQHKMQGNHSEELKIKSNCGIRQWTLKLS